MKQNEAPGDEFFRLGVFIHGADMQGLPSCVFATHCVLDAGAPAANRTSRASAVAGVTRKVMVQSKLTKVSFSSSGNAKSFQIYIYIYIFFNGSGAGFTLDITEHVPTEVTVVQRKER